jgi:flagellar FliL protein
VVAEVAGAGKIVVRADTTLQNGAAVSATMKQGDQDFSWFNPDTAVTTVTAGRITLTLDRREGAPTPEQGQEYRVALVSTLPDGTLVASDPAPVTVLPTFAGDFFGTAAAQPTTAPTDAAPTATAAQATAEPSPEATPEVVATQPLTATVRNGGNIRREPNLQGEVLGQVSAGEVVELLARSPDGGWYLLRAAEAEGYVSATLLAVPEDVAAQVPPETPTSAPIAQVFNGGNVRAAPNLQGEVLDQINAGETVQLLARTENGSWYLIINQRQITGWVSATLLEVALEDRRALPVSGDPVATPLPATREALPGPPTPAPVTPEAAPPSTGLTAIVFNGGNVRAAPNLQGEVLDQINGGETVQLLARTGDGGWYQITNVRGVTGWVNRTLLTVDPEVARRVPVA